MISFCSLFQLLLALLGLFVHVHAQDRLWSRLSGTTNSDIAYAVTVDPTSGAVYTCGTVAGTMHSQTYVANNDIFLMKYSSNGTRIWTKLVGTSGYDGAFGIVLDNQFVYITGVASASLHSQTFSGGYDIVLLKYSVNGTRLWTRQNGGADTDIGQAVAVDSSGSVYIAGTVSYGLIQGASIADSLGLDIVIIKYHVNGTRLWTKLIGTADYDDWAYGLAIYNDYLYITGGTASIELNGVASIGNDNSVLMKLTPSGSILWTKIEGVALGATSSYAVAIDPLNSFVYIAGYSDRSINGQTFNGGSFDIFIVKYDLEGSRISTTLAGTGSSDMAFALAVDSGNGEVYITGYVGSSLDGQSYVGSTQDVVVIKYASNGTRIWTKLFGSTGIDEGKGITVSRSSSISSNMYVVGSIAGSLDGQSYLGSDEIFLIQYSIPSLVVTTTVVPTVVPTVVLTVLPTVLPSTSTGNPSRRPSGQPSSQPSRRPSMQPSAQPSRTPTSQPSRKPSAQPSRAPSSQPSRKPTTQPSGSPTSQPSRSPSSQPSRTPSSQPSRTPTSQPSRTPIGQPSRSPSTSSGSVKTVCRYRRLRQRGSAAQFSEYRCFTTTTAT